MKWLDHFEEWLIAGFMAMATAIIFVAVLHRYLAGLHSPLQGWLLSLNFAWAQEATIYLFVWMAKFGAAYGVRTGIHVGVDVLLMRLPERLRHKVVIFGLLAGALFTGVIAAMGARFVWENGAHFAVFKFFGRDLTDLVEGPTTPDLEWPTWVIYLAIPLGSLLMCFRFLQAGWRFARTGELPRHDHGQVQGLDDEAPAA